MTDPNSTRPSTRLRAIYNRIAPLYDLLDLPFELGRYRTIRPGIFAALMIGLGRAVGETMIVLMATGNTPIMSLSPFNGMRTLAANIAVEIPEAPFEGTLYRTLFFSALLLFMFTFVLNSVAETVRIWLRGKYGRY